MTSPLRVVFAGTPEFAVPCLEACRASGANVVAVYTQPDRPAGRGRKLTASPVKEAALAAGIPVEQPESFKADTDRDTLAAYEPDLMVVVAYGLILPRKVLAIPQLGCWNVHASLLPRWRGAAPIQRAILAGDAESGVDLMQMEAGLDTGPVLIERRTPISGEETGGTLHDRLSALGADALLEGLRRVMAGETLIPRPQPEEGVAYAHKLDKAEALIDFALPADHAARKVRAFDPWPVAEADLAGERVRIWAAVPVQGAAGATPGSVIAASKHGIDVACAEGALRILSLQRSGGRRIGAADYLNARPELRQARA
ncbi:methionyl-tRNA formyltransferase [Luteibacter sp. Sphag1AF]|uniref:methionyl-tRNA formyltransferase n=1 Tax=Luteibacter sp. Sphag1AF TaxID=2587031 RepID=UPI001619A692|nr:methionyl-tRNA formyltransferase [Luteibacter sp. Sphag1AF]MBB3226409.1 methionyl-tRNA formyltransferase [Luteibacter sp. Sphag1AF]